MLARPFLRLLLFLLLPAAAGAQVPQYFVSPSGSDAAPGTRKQPFATVARAQAALRKKPGGGAIRLLGGQYRLSAPIIVTAADGPLTLAAVPGQPVSLSAAVSLPASGWAPLDAAAQARLHPKVSPRQVVAFDVSGLPYERLRRFSPARSFIEGWPSIDLYAAGQRLPMARWPNEGAVLRPGADAGWATYNGARDPFSFYYGAGGTPEDGDATNELELDGSGRARRWQAALASGHELWLKGFWRVPWGPITSKVRRMDSSAIELWEAPRDGMGSKYSAIASRDPLWRVGSGKEKWMLLNALEEIDTPGEWALDIKDQKIYYYPASPADLQGIEVAVSEFPLLRLQGARYVRIEGLDLWGTLGQAVRIDSGRNVTVAGCSMHNVGDAGILVQGGSGHSLLSNDIRHTGAAGIVMSGQGDRATLRASNSSIRNNHIHHIGVMAFSESIQLANSVGVTVAHNLLHDLPKSAIRTDGINDCLFEYNEIHNIALREADNGAFYNYGGWSTYGNVFRYNFIHHIHRSNGLYCDDGDSGDRFYGNVIHDAIEAIKFGGGHDNIAEGNLIVNSKSQNVDDRGIARRYMLGTPYEERLRELKPSSEPWRSYGARLQKAWGIRHALWSDILRPEWKPEYPNGSRMTDNVTVNSGPFVKPAHGSVTISGNDSLATLAEARFFDYAGMDLRSTHPRILAKVPGLNRFLPKTGLYKDSWRRTLPTRQATGGLSNRGSAGDPANEDQFVEGRH